MTWNIQCGLGVDGTASLERIAGRIREQGDADVICLQEVARLMPSLGEIAAGDQVAQLARLFDGYEAFFGPAIDRLADRGEGPRQAFGNLVLSRLPVLQVFNHALPQPADPAVKHMPRQASELVVRNGEQALRVLTTHLEYHSERQRKAQALRLKELQQEVLDNERQASAAQKDGPYARVARPAAALVCGDFNAEPGDAVYDSLLAPAEDDGRRPLFVDAWRHLKGSEPHAGTCGLYDRKQWPQGSHCRDYFFVSEVLAGALVDIRVDQETAASDHQPVWLRLYPEGPAKPL